jgi:hypothetical protein
MFFVPNTFIRRTGSDPRYRLGMQVGSGCHRHRVTTLVVGVRIAHDSKHIVERQNSSGGGGCTSLLGRAIARSLLSSTGFATASHGI